jgi:cation:H+ antiporter
MTYILLILGFAFLIKGAGLLVDGASSLAKKFNISNLVIGLTIVAFGTSAPELFVNLFASFNGTTDIAIGNIVGSNISNVFLILGIAAIIYPIKVSKGTVWKEIPLSLLAALLLLTMANDWLIDGVGFNALTRSDGIVLIAFFVIFIYYTFGIAKDQNTNDEQDAPKIYSGLVSTGLIFSGLVGLVIGGQWIVNSATSIAISFGLSEALIGLTIVAIGTSLPELATSAVAAYKKNSDIAVGNVVGSNIFNIFWILGLSAFIKPLPFKLELNFDLWMAVFASVLLFLWMFLGKRHTLDRWQGTIFVLIYVVYIITVVVRG